MKCWFSDPNKDSTGGETDQTWPEYNNDGQQVLVLDTDSDFHTQTGLRNDYCQFWDKLVPRLLAATTGTDFSPCVIYFHRLLRTHVRQNRHGSDNVDVYIISFLVDPYLPQGYVAPVNITVTLSFHDFFLGGGIQPPPPQKKSWKLKICLKIQRDIRVHNFRNSGSIFTKLFHATCHYCERNFVFLKLILHSDLRRRAASRRALPRTSSLLCFIRFLIQRFASFSIRTCTCICLSTISPKTLTSNRYRKSAKQKISYLLNWHYSTVVLVLPLSTVASTVV